MEALASNVKTPTETAPATEVAPAQTPQDVTPTEQVPEAVAETVETPQVEIPKTETTQINADNNAPLESQPTPQVVTEESVFANEKLAEANAYLMKNPEKSIEDYNALKVPTSEMNEKDLIRQYLSEKEGKTPAEIAYELRKIELELEGIDSDFDDEDLDLDTLKAKAEHEKLLLNAKSWRDDYVKEQLTFDKKTQKEAEKQAQTQVNEQDAYAKLIQDAETAQKQYREKYVETIYSAIPTITEIPVNVQGQEIAFTPNDEFVRVMREVAENPSTIGKQFFDETGMIKDATGFIKENTLWADPRTRQILLDFAVEQAVTRDRAEQSKVRRNVTLDSTKPQITGGDVSAKDAVDLFLRQTSSKSF